MKLKLGELGGFLVFAMVGLMFMFTSGGGLTEYFTFSRNAVEHTGTVVRIDTIQQDASRERMMIVKYTVSGQEYESGLIDYWGKNIGDEMKIYYNPKKPSDIRLNVRSDIEMEIIFTSLGAIVFLIGIGGIFSVIRKKKNLSRNVTKKYDTVQALKNASKLKASEMLIDIIFMIIGAVVMILVVNSNEISGNELGVLAIPAVFFLIGATLLFVRVRKKLIIRDLIRMNYVVKADFEEVVQNTSYKVNKKSPYIIYCKWVDKGANTTYLFKSVNLWYNPKIIIKEKGITTFPVYLNPNNPKQYYVSTEEIEEKMMNIK